MSQALTWGALMDDQPTCHRACNTVALSPPEGMESKHMMLSMICAGIATKLSHSRYKQDSDATEPEGRALSSWGDQ